MPNEVKLLPCEEVMANATRAICTRNHGGYCDCIGHEQHGCMVGWGQPPEIQNCRMTDAALKLTAEYTMACAALEATRSTIEQPPLSGDVMRLVIAAREVAYGGYFESDCEHAQARLRELDNASEAFASRIPWDEEPASVDGRRLAETENTDSVPLGTTSAVWSEASETPTPSSAQPGDA